MTLDPRLLEILVCPVCKAPVHLTPDEIGLACPQCRRVYPVKDDIPVMLEDEATIQPDPPGED
ncbi:MAG: Trm112 family protein [Acidobacteriota bacterium]